MAAPASPNALAADLIFNDPSSWNSGVQRDLDDAWDSLLDQFPNIPQSGVSTASRHSPGARLKPFTRRFRLEVSSPESGLDSDATTTDMDMLWEGVSDSASSDNSQIPVVLLNNKSIDTMDAMSLLLKQTDNLFRSLPSPLESPSTITGDGGLFRTPAATPRTAVIVSPLHPTSSATWSILEYYGLVSPEQPESEPPVPPSLPQDPGIGDPPMPSVAVESKVKAPPSSTAGISAPPPVMRTRSGTIRPLPAIPADVPPLLPPSGWTTPPRRRANTTHNPIRTLPPTPAKHRTFQSFDEKRMRK